VPWHVPQCEAQAQREAVQPADDAAVPGAKPSRGHEGDLTSLMVQLQEEYPGLSPERAEAALKLTKQNGRYNLYAAAAALRGREGAPDCAPIPFSSLITKRQQRRSKLCLL